MIACLPFDMTLYLEFRAFIEDHERGGEANPTTRWGIDGRQMLTAQFLNTRCAHVVANANL